MGCKPETALMGLTREIVWRKDAGGGRKAKDMRKSDKRTPALMFQGACSNAGKSVLTAAYCRMLLQDGYRVAPFKAQNMSLNSFVTPDGREIGRAQATQAMAARLEPDARMNPVLLKPSSDVGTQVIVLGEPVGHMNVKEYFAYKPKVFEIVKQAYDELAQEYDVLVLEGAGSPAEINLKAHDIVNMRMAEYAGAAVVLVGDIDRGGVFASLVGTWELLDPWERELVAGFCLNKFRGDASLLQSALDYTTTRTGRPFFGVAPHIADLGLPEEDSVSFKEAPGFGARVELAADCIDAAVVDLPHISNFTDFDSLKFEADVQVRLVRRVEDLQTAPDVLLLPGSKSTVDDLAYLRERGLAEAIVGVADAGRTEVVGVCGGFQMLGEKIVDPAAVESDKGGAPGLGLLPMVTEFGKDKILSRVCGRHAASGAEVYGYEIHHGRTRAAGAKLRGLRTVETIFREDGAPLGFARDTNDDRAPVWGTYLHGVFDADDFRRWFVNQVRARKGLGAGAAAPASYNLAPALDRLADVIREHTDWKSLYKTIGL